MADPSTFRGTLDFFSKLGVYDVVLPFLLVFTIVFAILEKTRVFGTDKIGEIEITKKSLNAITAFVVALFTIASSRLVETITSISSNIVIILLISIFFLMLVGSFHEQKDKGFFLEGTWRTVFIVLTFGGMILILLNALKVGDKTWLAWIMDRLGETMDRTSVAAVVLFVIMVGFLFFIIKDSKPPAASHH